MYDLTKQKPDFSGYTVKSTYNYNRPTCKPDYLLGLFLLGIFWAFVLYVVWSGVLNRFLNFWYDD